MGGMELPLIPILIFAMADEEERRRYKRVAVGFGERVGGDGE